MICLVCKQPWLELSMNHTAPEGTNKNEIEVISYSTIQVYLDIALKRFLALLHSNRKKKQIFHFWPGISFFFDEYSSGSRRFQDFFFNVAAIMQSSESHLLLFMLACLAFFQNNLRSLFSSMHWIYHRQFENKLSPTRLWVQVVIFCMNADPISRQKYFPFIKDNVTAIFIDTPRLEKSPK